MSEENYERGMMSLYNYCAPRTLQEEQERALRLANDEPFTPALRQEVWIITGPLRKLTPEEEEKRKQIIAFHKACMDEDEREDGLT